MASNPFDQFDDEPAAEGANPFDKFDAAKPKAASGEWEKFSVPARPRQFVSPEDRPARMVNQQRGTRQVPVEGPTGRAIYEFGGRTTDVLTGAGLPPEVAAAGGYLANVGGQVASSFIGGGIGKTVEPAAQALGKSLMTKALSPTPTQVATGRAGRAAETMLKGTSEWGLPGMNVSRAGVEKMTKDIDVLNDSIMRKIQNSNENIDKNAVASYAQRAYDKWKNQVNSATDVAAVRAAVDEFLTDPTIAQNIPAAIAQRLKQGTYRALGAKAYEPGARGATASVDAQKDLAYGLKEELARKHPGIGAENASESALIEARKLSERALAKQEARPHVGFGMLAHSPSAGLGWMAERSPYLKSMLARYFYHHADPEMAGRVAGAGVGAYSGSSDK